MKTLLTLCSISVLAATLSSCQLFERKWESRNFENWVSAYQFTKGVECTFTEENCACECEDKWKLNNGFCEAPPSENQRTVNQEQTKATCKTITDRVFIALTNISKYEFQELCFETRLKENIDWNNVCRHSFKDLQPGKVVILQDREQFECNLPIGINLKITYIKGKTKRVKVLKVPLPKKPVGISKSLLLDSCRI